MNSAKSNKSCQIPTATATTATILHSNQNGESDDVVKDNGLKNDEIDDEEDNDNDEVSSGERDNKVSIHQEKDNGFQDFVVKGNGERDNGIRSIGIREPGPDGHMCFSDVLFSGHCHDMDDYDVPLSGDNSPNVTMAGSPRGEFTIWIIINLDYSDLSRRIFK